MTFARASPCSFSNPLNSSASPRKQESLALENIDKYSKSSQLPGQIDRQLIARAWKFY